MQILESVTADFVTFLMFFFISDETWSKFTSETKFVNGK